MTAILVSRVGAAAGARTAAAALACAGSDSGRAGLLVDLASRRAPRSTLVASTAARQLEERLAAHLPEVGVASRGLTCHLTLSADRSGIEGIAAALPLLDDSPAAIHLPPHLVQVALEGPLARIGCAALRADLDTDRALTALAARDLMERGLRVAVLKQPLGWLASRRALAGLPPVGPGGGLPERLCDRLLGRHPKAPPSGMAAGVDEPAPARAPIQFRL